jgi:hypothetical protein
MTTCCSNNFNNELRSLLIDAAVAILFALKIYYWHEKKALVE